jgi:hypothetical protein
VHLRPRAFTAAFEQHLHTDADAKKRLAAFDISSKCVKQAPLSQRLDSIAERSHAWKDDR